MMIAVRNRIFLAYKGENDIWGIRSPIICTPEELTEG